MPGPRKCEVGCTCGHHPEGKLGPNERRERDRNRVRAYDPATHRRSRLKRIHSISSETFAAMWDAQEGRCCYCYCERPLPENPKQVHIDHDHSFTCGPNKSCRHCQRGLSCHSCNFIVGGDDPDRLERIATNLRRLKAEACERINGKPVQGELISIEPLRRASGDGP